MKQSKLKYQRGAALLLIAASMIVGAAALSYALLGDLGAKLKRQNAQEVSQALAEAKENLLIFASMQPELYPSTILGNVPSVGYLPPGDFDNDGRMGTFNPTSFNQNTNNNNVIGRLPALNRDASPNFYFYTRYCSATGTPCNLGDLTPIWYAMSGRNVNGDLRLGNRREPLNSNTLKNMLDANSDNELTIADCATTGVVCVDGLPVVAVLIASGSPLAGQDQTKQTDFTQYLDMNNSDTDLYNFISRFPVGQVCPIDATRPDRCFNDQVIAITYTDWKAAMERRVKEDEKYPDLCAGRLSANHWLSRNEWSFLCSS
jgi:hypothetical protein